MACVSLGGGYLASLNTAQEWDAVIELLNARASPRDVFVGLRAAYSTVPFMYGCWSVYEGCVFYCAIHVALLVCVRGLLILLCHSCSVVGLCTRAAYSTVPFM